MLKWFKRKNKLEIVLNATKTVKVSGIKFVIKKINPLDYLDGSTAMKQLYDTYQQAPNIDLLPKNIGKIKKHYGDVLLAAVVNPKLARKESDEGIFIENLFTDWELVNDLYFKIMEFTYGKKKMKYVTFQNQK